MKDCYKYFKTNDPLSSLPHGTVAETNTSHSSHRQRLLPRHSHWRYFEKRQWTMMSFCLSVCLFICSFLVSVFDTIGIHLLVKRSHIFFELATTTVPLPLLLLHSIMYISLYVWQITRWCSGCINKWTEQAALTLAATVQQHTILVVVGQRAHKYSWRLSGYAADSCLYLYINVWLI
mgnify:CR=1 FL=1